MASIAYPDSAPARTHAGAPIGKVDARTGYMPQLDALRFFAVMIVLWAHAGSGPLIAGIGLNGIGVYGVWLFFVLSGFLITGILLRSRDEISAGHLPTKRALSRFYIRRFLRIFPAYYALVFVLAAFDLIPGVRSDFVWHVTYLSNWRIFVDSAFPPGVGAFWTLAIEEQFYLAWPLIVFLTPSKRLPQLLVGMVVLSILFRAGVGLVTASGIRVMVATFSNLDCLALGGLIAWHLHHRAKDVAMRNRMLKIALLGGLAMIGTTALLSFTVQRGFRLFAIIETLGMALVSVWLVGRASAGFQGFGKRVLTYPPIVYLGTISYGIYLYHGIVNYGLENWAGGPAILSALGSEQPGWGRFLLVSALTFLVASVSWFLFEKPINDLKRRFPYS